MSKKFLVILTAIVLVLVVSVGLYMTFDNQSVDNSKVQVAYINNQGETQGTTYSITYQQPEGIDLQQKIEEKLHEFDMSLSTYVPGSVISRINNNDPAVETDSLFKTMFYEAQEISKQTHGALDITVGPLVKAWGFAFGNNSHAKFPDVNKFLPYIGYQKVDIVNNKLIKKDPRILIDANSIAQGFSCDVIGKLLSDNGCKNYMVEIGGEIVCRGLNSNGKKWRIGIDKAVDDSLGNANGLQDVISVTDCAVTTSGGYRKFFIKDGKKYSHIIDPRTGKPVITNVLSVTIVAPKAIIADGYDTPFVILGVDSTLQICKRIPGMECYLIYTDQNGKTCVKYSSGFRKYITQ